MTEANGETPPPAEPVQRGRYAVYQEADGIIIGYTNGLCDNCLNCGCGIPADEPVDLTRSGIMRTVMKAQQALGSGTLMGAAKAMASGAVRRGKR